MKKAKGVVSDVKDQGSCGSRWALSFIANLEDLYVLKKDEVKTFSEQLLIGCDIEDSGCLGGFMKIVFEWLAGIL